MKKNGKRGKGEGGKGKRGKREGKREKRKGKRGRGKGNQNLTKTLSVGILELNFLGHQNAPLYF